VKKLLLIIMFALLINLAYSAEARWSDTMRITNNAVRDSFTDISCTSPYFCMAVWQWEISSNRYEINASFWDGNSWSTAMNLTLMNSLERNTRPTVSCISPSFCMAAWEYNDLVNPTQIAYSTWNGLSWSRASVLTSASRAQSWPTLKCLDISGNTWCMLVWVNDTGIGLKLSYWDYDQNAYNGWDPAKAPQGLQINTGSADVTRPDVDCNSNNFCVASYTELTLPSTIKAVKWAGSSWGTISGTVSGSLSNDNDFSSVACGNEIAPVLTDYCEFAWENLGSPNSVYHNNYNDFTPSLGSPTSITSNNKGGKPDLSCTKNANHMNCTFVWNNYTGSQWEIVGTAYEGGWVYDPAVNISNSSSSNANASISQPVDWFSMTVFQENDGDEEIYAVYSQKNIPPYNFQANDNGAGNIDNYTDVKISATWTDPNLNEIVNLFVANNSKFIGCNKSSSSWCLCTDMGQTDGDGECIIDTAKQKNKVWWYARACDDEWNCSAYDNDSYYVTQKNKPYLTYVDVKPDNPNTTVSLSCNFRASDADSTDKLHANITWFVNVTPDSFMHVDDYDVINTPLPNGDPGNVSPLKIPYDHVNHTKHRVWKCQVTVRDGTGTPYDAKNGSEEIVNSLAEISSISLNPKPAYPFDDLVCNTTVSDADGDNLNVQYRFDKDGLLFRTGTATCWGSPPYKCNATVGSPATSAGETWKCTMNVTDDETNPSLADVDYDTLQINYPQGNCDVYINCSADTCKFAREFNISLSPFEGYARIKSKYKVCWS